MRVFVVIDTNVLVAAMLTRHKDSSTNRIINAVTNLKITPLYHKDILKEYREVLSREKFCFDPYDVNRMIDVITSYGIPTNREPSDEVFTDQDDVVFYEVALSKEGAYLVTGNLKHFPQKPIVVTPSEMIQILEDNGVIEKEDLP